MKKGSRSVFSNKKSKVGNQNITISGGGDATVQNSDVSYSKIGRASCRERVSSPV